MLLETLTYEGHDPRAWGRMHGETWRRKIQDLYRVRLELTFGRTDLGDEATALSLAKRHLPILERFDAALYDELLGISEGSGLSPEALVIVNHYTDFRDLSKKDLDGDDPGGCSAVCTPGERAPIIGETWDMHGSATDYVCLVQVPGGPVGEGEGRTVLFTIAGCVGMTGLTSWGLGMTINNLNSNDAVIGVLWPALVRRCLREQTAAGARDVVLNAPLGSGHHYLIADETSAFGIETSGKKRKVTQEGAGVTHLHTNHCLDEEMQGTTRKMPASTSYRRYDGLCALKEKGMPTTARGLYDAFANVSMERKPDEPHGVATCGAMVMDLAKKRALTCRGLPEHSAPLIVDVSV